MTKPVKPALKAKKAQDRKQQAADQAMGARLRTNLRAVTDLRRQLDAVIAAARRGEAPSSLPRVAVHVNRAGDDDQYLVGTVVPPSGACTNIQVLERVIRALWDEWRELCRQTEDAIDADCFLDWLEKEKGWLRVESDLVAVLR